MKKNIKKVLLFVLMPFLALIIGISAIVFNNQSHKQVYADALSYNFTGSNFYIPLTPQVFTGHTSSQTIDTKDNTTIDNYTDFATYLNTKKYFVGTSPGTSFNVMFTPSFIINYFNGQPLFLNNQFNIFDSNGSQVGSSLSDIGFSSSNVGQTIELYFVSQTHTADYPNLDYNAYGFNVLIHIDLHFPSLDFVGCQLYSEYDEQHTGSRNGYLITNHIKYFDKDNYYIDFAYRSYFTFNSFDCAFENRTYYFENALNLSSDNGYDLGYSKGYESGDNDGYQRGLSDGYFAAEDNFNENVLPQAVANAEQIGYQRGIVDANDYSFFGLITSIIDAPINTFKSLFNYEILGVNILSFLTGLITLGLVLFVIKFVAR